MDEGYSRLRTSRVPDWVYDVVVTVRKVKVRKKSLSIAAGAIETGKTRRGNNNNNLQRLFRYRQT